MFIARVPLMSFVAWAFVSAVFFMNAPVQATSLYELENSLTDRAKFKSLGFKNWAHLDPVELSRGQPLPDTDNWTGAGRGDQVAQLLTLIAFAEAGAHQYDAVHFGAKRKTPARPTAMTIGQIQAWVRATPGQPHAIGRYQFIPKTMNRLVTKLRLSKSTRFTPATQDKLALALLQEGGLHAFQSGALSQARFMDALAKIWAGLPTRSGRSHYHNYAGNKATISRSFYAREMAKIFAAR